MCQHPHATIDVPGRHHHDFFADTMKIEIDLGVVDGQSAHAQMFDAVRQQRPFDMDFVAMAIDMNA